MNNNSTHLLPPKSPGGYSMFGGSSLFEGGSLFNNVHSSFPIRDGSSHHHKRTPSAGYLPQVQPSWLEEILESPDHGDMATVNKKGLHRRASSDSVAFSESLYNSDIMAGRFAAEEERYSAQGGAPPGAHTLRIEIPDYNGPSGDNWALERGMKHPPRKSHHGSANNMGIWEKPRTQKATNVNAENASDSNSHSEGSNDDQRVRLGKYKSEPEVQSTSEGDQSHQGQQEDTQTSSEQIDPSLDPKKAKRQSAQRSRVRKLQYISELEMSVNALQTEVTTLSQQVGLYDHRRAIMTAENVLLKQKLAALGQTQRCKEAHNEALKKELQRLLYQQQQQQQHQLPPLSPPGYELQRQRFSMLDLGSQQQQPQL
ncbi:unnamed protein product [Sphagnum jensenii]|uniref:BZIP domain-containing protein n=1 Tax=Sphagnum jensenii TaxID=128206 RepID=A0ABP0X847_9BRYO